MTAMTYIINLPNRPDRLQTISQQLQFLGIPFNVWSAIKHENGRLGLTLTMEQLFAHCLKNNYDNVFVFEDDAKILTNEYIEIIDKCIHQLPENYDLLYAGCNLHGKCKRYSENLLIASGMYSSHSILYSRQAIEKILPLLHTYNTYDKLLVEEIQPYESSFCSYPLLVTQESGYSDIAGKEVNYDRYIEKRYNEKTKGI